MRWSRIKAAPRSPRERHGLNTLQTLLYVRRMNINREDFLRGVALTTGLVVCLFVLWMTGFAVMYDVEKHGWKSVGGLIIGSEIVLDLVLLWWLGFRAEGLPLRIACTLFLALAAFFYILRGGFPFR